MKSYFSRLYLGTKEDYLKRLEDALITQQKLMVITANPEIIMHAKSDDTVSKMLLDQEVEVIADGIGLVKAAKDLNVKIIERIPGVEIVESLLEKANERKKTLFIFGSKQEVIDALLQKINEKYKNLQVVGAVNGYVDDKKQVFDEIVKAEPDLCFVALGMPLQEKLIYENLNRFKKGIFIGVGGSFDVISGVKKRAPKIFIKLNLEWLYRLIREPSRIKRFYQNNIKFIFRVRREKRNSKEVK